MDAKHFDAMTKAWIRLPRRQMLGGLATGVLTPLLGLRAREVAAAVQSCGTPGDPACPPGQICRHGVCAPTCTDPFRCHNGSGGGGGTCANGLCYCAKEPRVSRKRKARTLCV